MAVDRRTFALAALAAMTGACARAREARAQRSAPSWSAFKSDFVLPSGRIVDKGNGDVSHSEGQGYGLWLALTARDRKLFDTILDWTEANLARTDMALFAWRYDPRSPNPVADRNNATDGDIFIAWALARAARLWREPAFARRSEAIRTAILAHLVIDRFDRRLLLPGVEGFASPNIVTVNPSYIIWPALDAFRAMDGKATWGPLITDSERLLLACRFGPRSLPTDWIDVTADGLAPAASKPPRFGFDAIRIPLYAMAGNRPALISPVVEYWRDCLRNGGAIPAWIDVQSGIQADYGLSAGGVAVADRTLGRTPTRPLDSDYYAAALQMLVKTL